MAKSLNWNRRCLGPGIYVHIPFCARKCYYCDFTAYVLRPGSGRASEYLQDLLKEIELYAADPAVRAATFRTLHLGGGTPSILTPDLFHLLIQAIRAGFTLAGDAEFTLEVNPEDLTPDRLEAWKQAGVNRLSIGVQASQAELLRAIGRNHDWQAVVSGYARARQWGFANINIDLMFGLPGQTLDQWSETLDRVLGLHPSPPEHISCYGLQVEEHTTFYRWWQEGRLALPDDDLEREMFLMAGEKAAAAGLYRYEISNFARPGFESRHNLNYWANGLYLGLGAGAWSYWQGIRYGNETGLAAYGDKVRRGVKPVAQRDDPGRRTRMAEAIMLGTRLTQGMPVAWFEDSFGISPVEAFGRQLKPLVEQGLVEITARHIRLTGEGQLLANYVWEALLGTD